MIVRGRYNFENIFSYGGLIMFKKLLSFIVIIT